MNLEGHAAIVTGGASGLGAATARALIERGAKVSLFDMNAGAVAAVAAEIGAASFGCDVTNEDAVVAAIAEAQALHGTARVLVNCAGIAPPTRIVGRNGPHPLDAFRRVVEVNLIGTFNVLRLFAAALQKLDPIDEGERGVIVMTASVAAFEGQIGQAAYAASKGGVAALTLPAAREFASSGIRVCTVAPGIFETPMVRGLPQAAQDSLAASIPFPSTAPSAWRHANRVGRHPTPPGEFRCLMKW
jgi:NAD(P)-dependent dehydrogenase (short-subunit alcohol dehydrogenase family)